MFGEIRSALHGGQFSRLTRWLQRGLPPDLEHYVIELLDRSSQFNAVNLGPSLPSLDGTTVLDALCQSVAYLNLSHAQRVEQHHPGEDQVPEALDVYPPTVQKVLVFKNGDGSIFYRRVVGQVTSALFLEQTLLELLNQPPFARSAGYIHRARWLELMQDDPALAMSYAQEHLNTQQRHRRSVLNALNVVSLEGFHDVLELFFRNHTGERYHHKETPWQSLKAVMVDAQWMQHLATVS